MSHFTLTHLLASTQFVTNTMSFSSTFLNIFLLITAFEFASYATCASILTKAIVLPITKENGLAKYTTHIKQRTPLVDVKLALDLGGQYTWVDCETGYVSSSYKPADCRETACKLAKSGCTWTCFGTPKPGCNNHTCTVFPYNDFISTSTIGEVAQDVVLVHTTNGASFGPVAAIPNFIFACAPTSLLDKLSTGTIGVAGLGRGNLGMPSLFATAFRFPRTFAICLASKGFAIFGNTPYNFLPSNVDYSKYLTYTPLFLNPVSTAGAYTKGDKSNDYFLNVSSIQINKTPVPITPTLLTIHRDGHGGAKLSTVQPYTVLETSIYKAFISTFKNAAAPIKPVSPVAPFGLCYHTKSFQDTYLGPAVPQVDLILHESGVKWFIYGSNSMVQVGNGVMCLGFIDAGVERPRTSIVVGAYQLDQHLLQFDLGKSRLGFSVSMRSLRSSCSNFNFTSNV